MSLCFFIFLFFLFAANFLEGDGTHINEHSKLLQLCMNDKNPLVFSSKQKTHFTVPTEEKNCFVFCNVDRYGGIEAKKRCCPGSSGDSDKYDEGPFYCNSIKRCCKDESLLHYNDNFCNPKNNSDKILISKLPKKCPTEVFPGTTSAKCMQFSSFNFEATFFQLMKFSAIQVKISIVSKLLKDGDKVRIEILKFGLHANIAQELKKCNLDENGGVKTVVVHDKVKELVYFGIAKNNKVGLSFQLEVPLKSLLGCAMQFGIVSGKKRLCCNILRVEDATKIVLWK